MHREFKGALRRRPATMITMTALHTNPLFTRLAPAERILAAGAGGGFDVYSGLPIAGRRAAAARRLPGAERPAPH